MKINRRVFVTGMAFAGGGALGLMLSPTPWYMMRDVAFWTQNWPWVPVPEQGKPSFARAACAMCGGGCGIKTRLIGTRLVEVAGDPVLWPSFGAGS